ncbi:ATP-binding protein [Nocardioides sp.]|uniref:ATP-binding protein n=1 Tax=Nocardioides sp. TaxID=35761 RepID=UPI0025D6AB61|nr:ATP-binding protein [Nocardioides sp.]
MQTTSTVGRPQQPRGRLTVYLGAAPGVGKTYAMLGEARRRQARGTDVVVGFVETHDRSNTMRQIEGLEVIPSREIVYRGTTFTELDVEAVIARDPKVVCVDELAHTNVPGSPHLKRAQDIEQLRAAGIDVITTVNIQHLESLNDEVERITGVRQRETVPDDLVRTADMIHLVDMAPQALRRRMAHGNVYKPENIDASLTSYFRVGNLTALRELALLWLADRVDDALGDYRREHQIAHPWPTKERIVVAVTGGPESETLLRRGARLCQRAKGSELVAVHVVSADGLARSTGDLPQSQSLTRSLGGTFHTVIGDDPATAIVDFAAGANATMIIVGVSRHGRVRRLFSGSTGDRIATAAGSIDVHLVTHEHAGAGLPLRRPRSALGRSRRLAGWAAAVVLPFALLGCLYLVPSADRNAQLPVASLLMTGAIVAVALIGGRRASAVAAMIGAGVLNFFFTQPYYDLTVQSSHNVVALGVFLMIALSVAGVVDQAARRSEEAARARAEASTIGALSRSVLTGQDTAEAIVHRVRESFGQRSVALLRASASGWHTLAEVGQDAAKEPGSGDTQVRVDDDHVIVLRGDPLRAADQRVLDAFAIQTSLVLEYRRLRDQADRALALERAEQTSTSLLRAVSHDLRTPLATMRAALDGLLTDRLPEQDRKELIESAATSADQLEALIDNLLDLSRVEAGLVHPAMRDVSLEESLPLAVAGLPPGSIVFDVDEGTPLVRTDSGLLERVVANLVSNAVRASAQGPRPGEPVRVLAHETPETVEVMVVDRGPGVPEEQRERMFEPFQRLDDTSADGLGLGLAVAKGLSEALGIRLSAEDTPGGGLTMVVAVPRAEVDR